MPIELTTFVTSLRTSEKVVVTLTVTGKAPLRVEWPKDLLATDDWEILGTDGGRLSADGTTWTQQYTLWPYSAQTDLPLAFNPITVNGTAETPNTLHFTVESLKDVTADDARPVTGIEELPRTDPGLPLIAVGIALTAVLTLVLAAVLGIARHRRQRLRVPAGEWVRGKLAELQTDLAAGRVSEAEFVNQLSLAVREYLRRRFNQNAGTQTTAELLAAGSWGEMEPALAGVLRACDEVKFAGQQPTRDECEALAEQAAELVAGWEEANGAT